MQVCRKLTPLLEDGIAHYILPVILVVVVAVLGGYTYSRIGRADAIVNPVYFQSSVASKCLDDWRDSTTEGTKVDLYNCNKTAAQEWTVNSNGTIENANGKCLDDWQAINKNGNPIRMYKCSATDGAQQWRVTGNVLKNPMTNKCVDDPNASSANGTQLQLFTCLGNKNQGWTAVAIAPKPGTPTPTPAPAPGSGGGSGTASCTSTTTTLTIHVCNGQLVNGQNAAVQLRGVDITGTEDACIQNQGFSWGASSNASEDATSATALKSWDINAVRIPLNEDCWLDINGAPAAYSGSNYKNNIEAWVQALNKAGIYTILDLHWSAPGSTQATQQWPMADADHSVTFWSQVASTFKSDPAVVFDLFNEPYVGGSYPTTSSWSCWLNGCSDSKDAPASASDYNTAGMQQMLNAVRAAGADQPVMVGGLNWAGNPCQSDGNSAQTCPQLSYMPKDTLSPAQLTVSVHSYQQDTIACTNTTCWNNLAATMKTAKLPVVAGEIGQDSGGCNYEQSYMDWADQQSPKFSYLVWAWQIGGSPFNLVNNWTGTPGGPEGPTLQAHLLGEGNKC